MAERRIASHGGGRRLTRWFVALHGGQVAMLWIGWGVLWWGLLWIGAATMGTAADAWAAAALTVSLGGGTLLMILTWLWFSARRID